MTRIETYKHLSLSVDYHLKIIDYAKIKNNKLLAKNFYTGIIRLVENYYLFNRISYNAKTILLKE